MGERSRPRKERNEPRGCSQHQTWKLLAFPCGGARPAPFSRLSPPGSLDSAVSHPPGSGRVPFVYGKFSLLQPPQFSSGGTGKSLLL